MKGIFLLLRSCYFLCGRARSRARRPARSKKMRGPSMILRGNANGSSNTAKLVKSPSTLRALTPSRTRDRIAPAPLTSHMTPLTLLSSLPTHLVDLLRSTLLGIRAPCPLMALIVPRPLNEERVGIESSSLVERPLSTTSQAPLSSHTGTGTCIIH